LNVRRLLVLLRRLALREGATYVFEPNDDVLRRSVRRSFTRFMTELFRRGAFSGVTEAQSFQLLMDGTLNTQADQDAGRFIVELRVAPSVPLRFLNVRLQQIGERLTVSESA
jgi:phage tail sheath protein FI